VICEKGVSQSPAQSGFAVGGGEDELLAKRSQETVMWCTERRGRVIDLWIAFSNVVIIVGRLVREGWIRYRWEGRPPRRP
jgi:hypothetical protein